MRIIPAAIAVLLLPWVIRAETPSPPRVVTVRATGTIRIDGRLDEPDWQRVPVTAGFRQWSPDWTAPSRLNTEVRVLFDDRFLYVGARMSNPAGAAGVVGFVHRRDVQSDSDWLGVYIDSLQDGRTAHAFRVNPANVQIDLINFDGESEDTGWDAVWESATAVDADGWTAELRIPIDVLPFRNGGRPQRWGIYFDRFSVKPAECSANMVTPRGVLGFVNHFPVLEGFEPTRMPRRREVVPFVSARDKIATVPPLDDLGTFANAGLDARLGLGFGELDLAVRPDFGQVEVDEQVLNLSTSETFLPEKRPFFVQGSEVFRTAGPMLFYSRRIGRALGEPQPPAGASLVESPLAADILAAAKFTGTSEKGFTLGLLGAVTEGEDARFRDASGNAFRQQIERPADFEVLRGFKRLDARGSYVGGLVTHAGWHGEGGRDSLLGATDFLWKLRDGRTQIDGLLVGTRAGTEDALRNGWQARLNLQHTFTIPWKLTFLASTTTRDYSPNDLGYLDRTDYLWTGATLARGWDRRWRSLRNWSVSFLAEQGDDRAGRPYWRNVDAKVTTEFTNEWTASLEAALHLPSWDDRELRTYMDPVKKYLRRPAEPYVAATVATATQKPWWVSFKAERLEEESGPTTWLTLAQTIRPVPRFEIGLNTLLIRQDGALRWLETVPGGNPTVGTRRLSHLEQIVRVSYAFTPRLTFQLFSEWFDANWAHRDIRRWAGDGVLVPATVAGPTSFSERSWALDAVGRWEFRPGSAAYVVFTRGVTAPPDDLANENGGISPTHDLAALRGLPAQSVVQVKVSWRV